MVYSSSRVGRSAYKSGYSSIPRYRSKSVDDLKCHSDSGGYNKYSSGDNCTSYDKDKYRSSYKGGSHGSAYSSSKYLSGSYGDKYKSSRDKCDGDKYDIGKYDGSKYSKLGGKDCGVDTSIGKSETKTMKYRVVGRLTPSPERKGKYCASLTLPDVSKDKDNKTDSTCGVRDYKDRYGRGESRGYTDLSPYGGRLRFGVGGGGKATTGGYPRPILRRRSPSRDRLHEKIHETLKRSRSLNDIVRSPSPRRHSHWRPTTPPGRDSPGKRDGAHTPEGAFPVCSRFPNCSVCIIDIPQTQLSRDEILHNMQHELKEEVEHIAMLEKKDKEIHLKAESISHITQILQKTKKELELKIAECNRRETECKQLKQELKCVLSEKKKIEHSHSEQNITISKLESVETRLQQLTVKYDDVVAHNKELLDRIKTLEINEKEFIDLERNVIDLQVQLRDMEDLELHRDELFQKLQYVKKQRDEFLEKGKIVEEERNEFVRSNKTLEQYLYDWKRKTAEFKKTNQALKDKINQLEKDKKGLEERIIVLQEERVIMQTNINKLEIERDDYSRDLRDVTAERNQLEHRVAHLEDTLSDYDQLEEGFHSLRLKVAELTRQRDDAEMIIPAYKAKVQVLKKAIREKENTILQLTHDLRSLRMAIENSTFEDLCKLPPLQYLSDSSSHYHPSHHKHVKNYFHEKEPQIIDVSDPKGVLYPTSSDFDFSTESDSYDQMVVRPTNHHHTKDHHFYNTDKRYKRKRGRRCVVLFDYDPYRSSTSDHPERELKLREGDYVTVYGEMDVDGYLEAEVDGIRGLVPSIYVEELSEDGSIDFRRDPGPRTSGGLVEGVRKFVVLYDYDPYTMGTTDSPDRQLALRKGDIVTVYGNVDVDGYYDAIRNGRRGLIPSNFVEEYSSNHHHHSSSHHQQTSGGGHHQQPSSGGGHHHHSGSQDFEGTIEVEETTGPPYAPHDLKVIRVVTQNAVLLGWDLPHMDAHGKSNGCAVTGYRIWVNGKRKQDCNSPTMNKCLVEDVDLHGRVEFSIQSVGDNGFCSEKCHFAITGALAALPQNNHHHHSSHTSSEMYVALYDYDPSKSSPNPNPSLELEFHEGDLIRVLDTSRHDGFYSAELNGKRGLVPSNFIERLNYTSQQTSHQHSSQQQRSTQRFSNSDSDSNSRRVQFQKH